MFRFNQYGWYKSLTGNNSSNSSPDQQFTATSVNGGGGEFMFNREQQRIILNPMDPELDSTPNTIRLTKKQTVLNRLTNRLPFFTSKDRYQTTVLSPMSAGVSQSSLIYAQLDEENLSNSGGKHGLKLKPQQKGSLTETMHNKLKLKTASSDESDREEILMDDLANRRNDDRVYLDLSKIKSRP